MNIEQRGVNKKKILNDPVYGFIQFPASRAFNLIEHPWFQRLRRIKQLGLTELVYPGARHTRFHHAMGATYLMSLALDVLRSKGHEISNEEYEAGILAILLHDIGHGPFSHALENKLVGVSHEDLTLAYMRQLNKEFEGSLDLAMQIFTNQYDRGFFHQLVSSQLDVDRLDYLRRDSFYTGVSEGVIGSDRIIKMLDMVDDQLVVEKKGIYSIEKFLIARRLMYWQVYLHKTVHVAEQMLLMILKRAKEVYLEDKNLFVSPAFAYFLKNQNKKYNGSELLDLEILEQFSLLDDTDVTSSIKVWTAHPDKILSELCDRLINRRLFKIYMQDAPFDEQQIHDIRTKAQKQMNLSYKETSYFVISDTVQNNAYRQESDSIFIKDKNGVVDEIVNMSDMLNIRALSTPVNKYFLCFPKELL
jgi:HD superfamily phosphohydrolase